MNIRIITVGKPGEKYLADAAADYTRRISRFARISIIELPPRPIPANASQADIEAALEREGGEILRRLGANAYVAALCVEAAQLSSEAFAEKIGKLGLSGRSNLDFIIGGSMGLSAAVKERADMRLGISQMTFPHQLARILLLEQIYRAFKINSNQTYHK